MEAHDKFGTGEGHEPSPVETDNEQIAAAADEGLMLDRLRKRREEIADPNRTHDIDIQGFGGELFGRYHVIPGGFDAVKRIQERAERSRNKRKELYAACDILIAGCIGLYMRDPEGKEHPLGPPGTHEAPTFSDPETCAALNFPMTDRARQIVRGVFGACDAGDIAIMQHQIEYSDWVQDASVDDDEDFLGES